jgi:hypothetical protein
MVFFNYSHSNNYKDDIRSRRTQNAASKGTWFCCFIFFLIFLERKRGRQTYTRYQTLELEKEFHFNREVSYIRRQLNYETKMSTYLERYVLIIYLV